MAQIIADRRDIDFVLHEQMNMEELTRWDEYREFNRKTIDMIISEARSLAVKEILPTLAEGDRQGVRLEDGGVKVPDCFHRPFRLFVEGEWTAMTAHPDLGGQGLPRMASLACSEYFVGANHAFSLYGMVGCSAGELIEFFGNRKQKELYLKKMYTGQWSGTMQLTEPQAGSDVGALTTSAVKNPDGSYSLTGNKIFITAGDQDLTENIIHPVLARVEGAPPGVKGISLFITPKIRVNDDGSMGEPNDVVCIGVEKKMGLHASATCSMTLGGKGKCRGWLLGEENKGMRVMFHMMNHARLATGFTGFATGSAAYLHALKYARERVQGKDLEKSFTPDAPRVPIIQHPDVRRMLLWMKVHVEGMRSLVYFAARCFDRESHAVDEAEKTRNKELLDILTPIIKSYCSERGSEICVEAMQVFGGYGYTREFPVEQLLRDCKVTSIYEGTNGIQAMDLLGRKLGMKNGTVFMNLLQEIRKSVAMAREAEGLAPLAEKVAEAVNRLGETAMALGSAAMSPEIRAAFSHAKPFLDVMGDVCMAWMLLWRAAVAAPKLAAGGKPREMAFYEGQIKSAQFFINTILPVTLGKMTSITGMDGAAVEIPEKAFGG
ncbi:MAG: acyl-CoA dehydrogenase [Desulfobacterales bacterium]|nr:acyl-CoA dehydrogenase [Desulfobacterales bacterium]